MKWNIIEVGNYTNEEIKMKQKSDSSLEKVAKCIRQGIKLPRKYCRHSDNISVDDKGVLVCK